MRLDAQDQESCNRFKKDVLEMAAVAPSSCSALRRVLADWYIVNRRDLPWRRTRDPYLVWVSEVMLQQTQVRTVEPYYLRFVARFPDVDNLARADLQEVLKLWEGLGYYSRARNLYKSAGIVASRLAGRMPGTWEALRSLPGVGDYIAAAVLSIALNRAYAVVDGNVKRVLARLFLVDTPVNQASSHKVFHALARQLLDTRRPGRHNQAMMELGALVCTPLSPRCEKCPVNGFCLALQKGITHLYPQRNRRAPLPIRRVVAAVVVKDGRILMVRRPEEGLLGGLWEFPGGSLAEGADPLRVCRPALKETVNLDVRAEHRIASISHGYTHFKLRMELCLCRWQAGRVRLKGPAEFKWLASSRIGELPLHGAMHKALRHLLNLEKAGSLG
jgi:A/G-specific adenine glycosylase